MPIYQIKADKFEYIDEKKIDLEKDIQLLTEKNLESVFNLKFVSGASNREFSVRIDEQDFYVDTLAFDEDQKSFVIIEYKKVKSISVIDQGFAYLSAMLRNKAEFILEINERLGKNFHKDDVKWEQSRVIFVSPEFTNYQTNAVNFKDLPISLYTVKLFQNNSISYEQVKPNKTSESINSLVKDKVIQQVSKEVKVYERDDLVKSGWTQTNELINMYESELMVAIPETRVKFTKFYIAYMSKHGRNYAEIVPQQRGLKIYFRFPYRTAKSSLEVKDCSKVGRFANGISYTQIFDQKEIQEAVKLSQDSYNFLHKDIHGTNKL